jgi:hypothetical protein
MGCLVGVVSIHDSIQNKKQQVKEVKAKKWWKWIRRRIQ